MRRSADKKTKNKKKTRKNIKTDPGYIQMKIDLIEKGLPIDISEEELLSLEETFRGARSFCVDLLKDLEDQRMNGDNVEKHIVAESRNLASIELALRKIDEFRTRYIEQIKRQKE